ncbi:SH3 domain-containing protein [Chitinibacter sp. ZOR0017]|uniref:SH3 domain-containing protein n=1 Tax=Chitinibacter sp. ZOR0017 TaxID=1339254 RepID=UPI00068FBE16|nr:SH3 domain-containing protein [Chitinibacter sp. ZOR0017]
MSKPLINRAAYYLHVGALLALAAGSVHALEYRSSARHGVILYEAPNENSTKRFVLSANIPLELIAEQGNWLRVRDRDGTLAWLAKTDASSTRYVQVSKLAEIRVAPQPQATTLFKAERNVLLQLLDNTGTGWLKVKHRDGHTGYIRIEEVWGV